MPQCTDVCFRSQSFLQEVYRPEILIFIFFNTNRKIETTKTNLQHGKRLNFLLLLQIDCLLMGKHAITTTNSPRLHPNQLLCLHRQEPVVSVRILAISLQMHSHRM